MTSRYQCIETGDLLKRFCKGENFQLTEIAFSFCNDCPSLDLTPLNTSSVLPCPQLRPVDITNPPPNLDEGPCSQ